MADKDGIIKIGFDYQTELKEAIRDIEDQISKINSDLKLFSNAKTSTRSIKPNPQIEKYKEQFKQLKDTLAQVEYAQGEWRKKLESNGPKKAINVMNSLVSKYTEIENKQNSLNTLLEKTPKDSDRFKEIDDELQETTRSLTVAKAELYNFLEIVEELSTTRNDDATKYVKESWGKVFNKHEATAEINATLDRINEIVFDFDSDEAIEYLSKEIAEIGSKIPEEFKNVSDKIVSSGKDSLGVGVSLTPIVDTSTFKAESKALLESIKILKDVILSPKANPDFASEAYEKLNQKTKNVNVRIPLKPYLPKSFEGDAKKLLENIQLTKEVSLVPAEDVSKDLEAKWAEIQEKFDNAFRSNGSFKSGAFKELVDLYSEYINLGGTNTLSALEGQEQQVQKLVNKYEELTGVAQTAAEAEKEVGKASKENDATSNASSIEAKQLSDAAQKEISSIKAIEEEVKVLTQLIGETKVAAIVQEQKAMNKAATAEVQSIKKIATAVDELLASLKSLITGLESLSLKSVGDADKTLANLSNVKPSIENLNTKAINDVGKALQGLKITPSFAKNINELSESIKNLVENFAKLNEENNLKDNALYKQLTKLISKADALRSMADILKNYSKADVVAASSGDAKSEKDLKSLYEARQANLEQILKLYKEINAELNKKAPDTNRVDSDKEAIQIIEERNASLQKEIESIVASGVEDNRVSAQKIENLELIKKKEYDLLSKREHDDPDQLVNEMVAVADAADDIPPIMEEADKATQKYYHSLKDVKKVVRSIVLNAEGEFTDITETATDTAGSSYTEYLSGTVAEKKVVEDLSKTYSELNKLKKKSLEYSQRDIKDSSTQYQIFLGRLKDTIEEIDALLKNNEGNLNTDQYAQQFKDLVVEGQNLTNIIDHLEKGSKSSERVQLLTTIYQWMAKNTKAAGAFNEQLTQITNALNNDGANANVKSLAEQFNRIKAATANSGLGGLSSISQYSQSIQRSLEGLLARFLSLYRVIGYLKSSIQTVRELDDALVDLSKTAHMSTKELDDFYLDSSELARQMGVTTKAIIDQAAAWSRLGYNTAETASQMALLSSKFASISPGMDTDEAQAGLVSVMKAWDVDTKDVEREIMDKINILGNNFAESNADLVTAIEKVGATLAVQGTSIDDALALITGAQEVVQNADIVGTALKTLSLRIRGYDEETEELSEDVVAATGKVADLTKVASNNFQGISLWTDATQTEYKPLLDYLREISEIWDEIAAADRTKLLENLFGKRGATVGSSILLNFDQVEAALEQMEESAGSADKEMEKIRNSISYKINDLQQLWVGFIQDTFSRDAVKGAVDGLTSLSEVFIKMLQTPGVNVATIGAIAAGIIKLGSASKGSVGSVTKLSTAIRSMLGMATGADSKNILDALNTQIINDTANSLKTLDKSQAMTVLSTMSLTDAQKVQILSMKGLDVSYSELLAREQAENIQKVLNNSETLKAAVASKTLSVEKAREAVANGECSVAEAALVLARKENISVAEAEAVITSGLSGKVAILSARYKALAKSTVGSVFGFNALLIAITAVATVSVLLYKRYKKEKEYADKLAESVKGLVSEYENQRSTVKKNASSAQSMYEEYDRLAKGVDKFGNNLRLSNDDFERYNKLSNEIGDLFPNLISGYSDTGDAILKCKNNVAALNEELEEQNKAAYRTIIDGVGGEDNVNADTIMESYRNTVYGQDGWSVDTNGAKKDKTIAKQYTEDIQELSETLKNFNFEDIDATQGNNYLYYYSAFLNDFKGDTEKAAEFTANMFQGVGDEVLDLYEKVAKLMFVDGGADLGYIAPWASTEAWASYEEIVRETTDDAFELADKSEEDIKAALRNVKKVGDAYLHLYHSYDDLSKDQAKAASTIIQNISSDTLESLEIETKEDLESYVHDLVDSFNDSEISDSIIGLFSIEPGMAVAEAQKTAQKYLDALKGKIDEASFDILTGLFDYTPVISKLEKAVESALVPINDGLSFDKYAEEYEKLLEFVKSLPEEQANSFLEYVAKMEGAVTKAQDVIDGWNEDRDIAAKGYGFSFKNVAEVTDGIEKISSKYNELIERIENGASDIERAFDLSDVIDLIDDLGLDLTEEEIKDIESVLSGGAASGEEMIAVLERLATAWVNAKLAVGEYTDEEKQNLVTQLTLAGIAEDVAKAFAEDRSTPLKFGGANEQSILGFSYKNVSEVVDGLSDIKSQYDDLVDRVEEGAVGEKLAASITDVVKMVEDLNLDIGDEDVARLVDTLTTGTASADEMKAALNELATTWAKTTLSLTGYSEEQKQLVSTQLQAAGVTKESADKFVEYISEVGKARDWVTEKGIDLSNMTKKEVVELGQEAKAAGITGRALNLLYQETLGVGKAGAELVFGTENATEEIKTVYDNIEEVAGGLKDISSLYKDFVDKVNDGEVGRGLAMDIEDIQKLFDKENGLDLGFSDEDIARLTDVLGGGWATETEIEDAFNEIATAWVNASFSAEGYSENLEQLLITQLQLSGATEESAEAFVKAIAAGEEAARLILDNGEADDVAPFGFSYENLNDVVDGIGQIKAIYDEFEQKIEDGEVGKKLAADIDDVVKLFDKENGLKFDLPDEEIERIKEVLTSGSASPEEFRDALNELVTAFTKATLASGDFTDMEKEQIATQLENAGMTRESAEAFAALVSELKEAQTATLEFSSALDSVKDKSVSFEQNIADVGDGIEKIASLYKDFESKVSDGKIGQELAADMSEVLELFDKDTGLDFGLSDEKIKQLQATLTSGASSAEEMQAAFDELATAWVDASLAAGNYSEEQQQIIATQLEMAGITRESAEAYVQSFVEMQEARQWLIDQGYDLANATEDEVVAMADEAEAAGISKIALYELRIAELDLSDTAIYTDQVCDEILNIATACGISEGALGSLKSALNSAQAGAGALAAAKNATTAEEAAAAIEAYNNSQSSTGDINRILHETFRNATGGLNFARSGGGGGGGGAKETADAIVSAFEDEYNALKELLDQGKIDQYQYLQYLRALYMKYFRDKKKYLKEYERYEREYLQGMKSMYESAFSYLTKKIDARISELNSQRSAAVAALEAERDAAIAAIDAQIDAIEEQIDALDDQIDAYNDEIDAINKANEARQREITLQKALLELNEAQDQRTNLVYSESGGMHYEANRTSLRDVEQAVQEAKDEIEIANIRTKIDLLEDEKEALEDQREELEKQKDEINKYYDQLIKETEAYYDALIENLEKTKSAIEQILDIEEEARMRAMLADLGVQDVDALISAFENGDLSVVQQFKDDYMGILKDMYSENNQMIDQLAKVSDVDFSKLTGYIEKTVGLYDGIQDIDFSFVTQGLEACETINKAIGGVLEEYHSTGTQLGEEVVAGVGEGMNSETAVASLTEGAVQTKDKTVEELNTAFDSHSPSRVIAEEVGVPVGMGVAKGMVDALDNPETQGYIQQFVTEFANLLTTAFQESFDLNAILNGGEDGDNLEALNTFSTIFDTIGEKISAMQESINGIDLTPAIMAFQSLSDIVTQVSEAISGGGVEGGEGESGAEGQATGSGTQKKSNTGESGGGASGLIGAMEEFGTTSSEVLVGGEGGEGEGEGEGEAGGVVGQFGQLRDAVMEASSAIGTGDDESDTMFSPSSGEGGEAGTLIAAHKALAEVVDDEEIGLPHHISQWEKVIEKIQEATEKLIEFAEEIAKLAAQSPYEIHIIYEAGGSFTGLARGTLQGVARAGGSVELSGAAFAGGQAGLKKNEDALVGELGPEMLIRDGRWSLVGLDGAEFKHLKAGDIILSAQQTEEILKSGKLRGRGTSIGGSAHADGTPFNRATTFVNEEMTIDAINALSAKLVSGMTGVNSSLDTIERDITNMTSSISNISNNANNSSTSIAIGDIYLSEVQNVDGFAKAIKAQLPGRILQELHR